jgi:hypothetical protein
MNNILKVAGQDSLVRDMASKAIINTNTAAYDEYISRRNALQAEKDKLSQHDQDISSLKNDISAIKQMLHLLLKDR